MTRRLERRESLDVGSCNSKRRGSRSTDLLAVGIRRGRSRGNEGRIVATDGVVDNSTLGPRPEAHSGSDLMDGRMDLNKVKSITVRNAAILVRLRRNFATESSALAREFRRRYLSRFPKRLPYGTGELLLYTTNPAPTIDTTCPPKSKERQYEPRERSEYYIREARPA